MVSAPVSCDLLSVDSQEGVNSARGHRPTQNLTAALKLLTVCLDTHHVLAVEGYRTAKTSITIAYTSRYRKIGVGAYVNHDPLTVVASGRLTQQL